MKKERMSVSDEQRERMLIEEQIERAAAEAESSGSKEEQSPPAEEVGLKRDETTEKVVLSLAPKPGASSSGIKLNALKPAANPLKASNPLKRPNVFKQAAAASSSTALAPFDAEKTNGKKRELTAAERLIYEDQERKRRRMEREAAA